MSLHSSKKKIQIKNPNLATTVSRQPFATAIRSRAATATQIASFSLLPHKILHLGARISSLEITQPPLLRCTTASLKVAISFVPDYNRVASTPFLFFYWHIVGPNFVLEVMSKTKSILTL
jgi:hypothetical protein